MRHCEGLRVALGTAALASLLCAATTLSARADVSAADRKFAIAAAQGGMAEVKLGELAVKNGASDSVKKFGQRMVDDHSKANDELKQIATNKGIALPTDVD